MDLSPESFVAISTVIRWASLAVLLLGLIACLVQFRLSRWMWFVAAGFAWLVAAWLWNIIAQLLLQTGDIPAARIGIVTLIGSLISLVSMILLVLGIWGLLRDLRARLTVAIAKSEPPPGTKPS